MNILLVLKRELIEKYVNDFLEEDYDIFWLML